jgi:hypothetical protein
MFFRQRARSNDARFAMRIEVPMKRTVISAALLLVLFADQAHAFVFTDIVAQVQRIMMILQASQYIEQINSYRQEFDKYQKIFDQYFKSFHLVYRRLSSADWKDFIPTNWIRLKDHLITIWKTFDEGAWQLQVLALRINPLYAKDPDYRQYADSLIRLSEEQVARLKKEEAHLIELQNQDFLHHEDLEKFKRLNSSLAVGKDEVGSEIALSQQIALTNAILIKLASIQAESKVVGERLLTDQREQRNLITRMKQLEIEAQKGDLTNLDRVLALTKAK